MMRMLTAVRQSGHELCIRPIDGSAGRIDGDEWAAIWVAVMTCVSAMIMITVAIRLPTDDPTRPVLMGAGIPMITGAAGIALGRRAKKS